MRTIRQSVKFKVMFSRDVSHDCVEVSIREVVQMSKLDRERENLNPGSFERLYPWYGPRKIDRNGFVTFTSEYESLDLKAKAPPVEEHPFSNRVYKVRFSGCLDETQLEIPLSAGKIASNDMVQMEVVEVGSATFVN